MFKFVFDHFWVIKLKIYECCIYFVFWKFLANTILILGMKTKNYVIFMVYFNNNENFQKFFEAVNFVQKYLEFLKLMTITFNMTY